MNQRLEFVFLKYDEVMSSKKRETSIHLHILEKRIRRTSLLYLHTVSLFKYRETNLSITNVKKPEDQNILNKAFTPFSGKKL